MSQFPLLLDADDAINHHLSNENRTDAELAYIVATLSKDGYQNKKIREVLGIEKVYTVTHLKRSGMNLTEEELTLWHKNPNRITLGHVRAIALLPQRQRENLLRELLSKRIPVHKYEAIAHGKDEPTEDSDIQRYQQLMSDVLGRSVGIKYNAAKKSGTLTLTFYSLDDLDETSKKLGFNAAEHI